MYYRVFIYICFTTCFMLLSNLIKSKNYDLHKNEKCSKDRRRTTGLVILIYPHFFARFTKDYRISVIWSTWRASTWVTVTWSMPGAWTGSLASTKRVSKSSTSRDVLILTGKFPFQTLSAKTTTRLLTWSSRFWF